MTSDLQLDHTVINVGFDMDEAQDLFSQAGFQLTDRGYHTLGSINHLMIFGTDYLELLGLPRGQEPERKEIAEAPLGLNGLVFKTEDVDATYAHLQELGMAGDPPKAFSRPVELPGETRDARFRTVHVRPDVFPAGRVYFCEHGTPDLVWRSEWQEHDNGARSIPEFVVVANAQAGQAEDFARLLRTEVTGDGDTVAFDGGKLTILSPERYNERYGAMACSLDGRETMFGALVCASGNPGLAAGIVADGIEIDASDGRTLVRFTRFNALIEFIA
jgi:hypothetical protein